MRLLLPVFLTCANALLLPNIKRLDDSATETTEIAARNGTEDSSGNTEIETSAGNDSTSSMYIVVLKEEKEEAEYEEHEQWVLNQFSELRKRKREEDSSVPPQEVEFFNVSSFHGYAGEIPESLLNTIRENPLVDFVEQDSRGTFASITTQNNSGIQVTDPEFEGRARWGASIDDPAVVKDNVGHGTHVAGVVGSKTYGVAKQVDLVAVKVGDVEGAPKSNIIKGIQYAVSEHKKMIRAKTPGFKGSIINISIGVAPSKSLDRMATAAIKAGVQVVVSAGNENEDACDGSPQRAAGAITVGSTGEDDERLPSSNYGRCVDIHAPGRFIESVGLEESPKLKTGTSESAAHVSGLLAYLLSLQPDQGSGFFGKRVLPPAVMRQVLFDLALRDVVTGLPPNTANLFAYNGEQSPLAQVLGLVSPDAADSGAILV